MSSYMQHVGQARDHEFSPVFRFLDEIDRHFPHRHRFVHTYIPRFDLQEIKDSYVLYGELPGALQKDLTIIATDNHTLEISGHVERLQDDDTVQKTEDDRDKSEVPPEHDTEAQFVEVHHEATESTGSKAAVKGEKSEEGSKMSALQPKWLLSERLVGQFHRSFSFAKPIESTGVTAIMKNGILKVVVPKGPAPKETKVPVRWEDLFYAGL